MRARTWVLMASVLPCWASAVAVEFRVAPAYPTGLAPYAAALADMDGDSDLDVVTVDLQDQETGTVSVSLNDGGGHFAAATSYPVGPGSAWLAVGDLNDDQRPDVVVSNTQTEGTAAVSVYMNNGSGALVSPHTLVAPAGAMPQGIAIDDWNGDGDADVAVALMLANQVKVFWGNGTGNFPASTAVATTSSPRDLAAARFDGDAHLDLVVTSIDAVQVFYGTGSGFVPGAEMDNFFFSSDHVAAGDFDGNGHPDFVTTGRALTLFLSDGTGHAWTRRFTPAGENAVGVAAGDVDGDGNLDVAAAVYLGGAVSVYYGDGDGNFPVRQDWGVGLAPNEVAIGDVDGDGLLDLVAPSSQLAQAEYQVVLNGGGRTFLARQDFDVVGDAQGFAVADFDRDGNQDVIVAVYESNADNLKLIAGNGDGTMQLPVLVETFGNSMPTNVIAADFDGDGWMDAAASIFSPGNALRVWINDGAGALAPSVVYPAGGNPGSLAAADLTGDGDLDVVVVNSAMTDNTISVFVGLGDGAFLPGYQLPTLVAPSDVAIADFDRDGDRDVLVTHGVSPGIRLFVNDGAGGLTPVTMDLGVVQSTPAVADLDGDGWLDVALTTGVASVLFNDQAGGFTLQQGGAVASGGVGLADFDHDGDSDLVATDFTSSLASVLLNDGSGQFVAGPVMAVGYQAGRCTGADLDHDLLPEIVTANVRAGSISIVTNTTFDTIFGDGFESGDSLAWSTVVAGAFEASADPGEEAAGASDAWGFASLGGLEGGAATAERGPASLAEAAAAAGPPASPSSLSEALFSTYLGGGIADQAWAIAVDPQGNTYITGYTASDDFPTLGALQPITGGQGDAFVSKFGPDGALVYSTYLGGDYFDYATAIAVDAQGSAYVAGWTGSSDFPTVKALQAAYHGGWDAFVAKLAPDGQSLVYSTYLGGAGSENALAIAVDATGSAYVAGETQSTDFPLVGAFQSQLGGSEDAFVAKLSPEGDALVYATYLGGALGGEAAQAIGVDADGAAHVAGWTTAGDFPTQNAHQGSLHGVWDAFVTKLSSSGGALVYSTFLGGGDQEYVDQARAIAVDPAGAAYVAGFTGSWNFPVVNAFQYAYGGQVDVFVGKLGGDGQLLSSTYLGGGNSDVGNGIALDRAGNIVVAGLTLSPDFPVAAAIQPAIAGFEDLFVTMFRPDAQALGFSTYYGGDLAGREDYGATGVALDPRGKVHVVTQISTLDFPVVNPYQASNNGSYDAGVVELAGALLFVDDFRSGDFAAWSGIVGGQ